MFQKSRLMLAAVALYATVGPAQADRWASPADTWAEAYGPTEPVPDQRIVRRASGKPYRMTERYDENGMRYYTFDAHDGTTSPATTQPGAVKDRAGEAPPALPPPASSAPVAAASAEEPPPPATVADPLLMRQPREGQGARTPLPPAPSAQPDAPLLRPQRAANDWSDLIPLEPAGPVAPNYIVIDGRRYPLPIIKRSGLSIGGAYLLRAPYTDALAALAGGFDVDVDSALSFLVSGRLRFHRYGYAQLEARYDDGELVYYNGAQREAFDFSNLATEARVGAIWPLLPTLNADGFVGLGAYQFDAADGAIADISDSGTHFGVNLTALLRWRLEAAIGYHQVASGNVRVDDENSEDLNVELRLPLRDRTALMLRYATGTERIAGGISLTW